MGDVPEGLRRSDSEAELGCLMKRSEMSNIGWNRFDRCPCANLLPRARAVSLIQVIFWGSRQDIKCPSPQGSPTMVWKMVSQLDPLTILSYNYCCIQEGLWGDASFVSECKAHAFPTHFLTHHCERQPEFQAGCPRRSTPRRHVSTHLNTVLSINNQ